MLSARTGGGGATGSVVSANFSPIRPQQPRNNQHLEVGRAPQSNFFGGTFLSPKTSMMQTKTNEYKMRVIQGAEKRHEASSTTVKKPSAARSSLAPNPSAEKASAMLGLTQNNKTNPLLNFNPAPGAGQHQRPRLTSQEGPRPAQRYKWGGVDSTPLFFKGKSIVAAAA